MGRKAVNINSVYGELNRISSENRRKFKIRGSITVEKKGKKVIIANYNKEFENDIEQYVKYLKPSFDNRVYLDMDKLEIIVNGSETIKIKFKEKKVSSQGRVPADVQEKGTVFVFNQVLDHDKNYKRKEDILADDETREGLEKIFKKYPDRLEEWTHSYYEHQKEFFKEFSESRWTTFRYGKEEKDLVSFFKENMSKLVDNSQGGYKDVTRSYESWNPSDIWAVYDNDKVNDDIEEKLNPEGRTLTELNNLLMELMHDKKLIGISLKKIKSGNADFKYVNTTKHKNILKVEEYKMRDINFDIKLENEYSNVNFGSTKNHQISVGPLKNGNLAFNIIIKGSGGMGGQAPTKMVMKLLNESTSSGITFKNDHNKYPKKFSEYSDDSDKYEKMYNKLPITNKNYALFEKKLKELYDGNKPYLATSKLMIINFFHDALINNSDNAEFWVDILYYGMKLGSKGGFAPHGKLS
jgi:hypothetical protein